MAAVIANEYRMRQHHRRAFRRERLFRDRSNPLEKFDDVELVSKFRFRAEHIRQMTDELEARLSRHTRLGTIPPLLQICIALRFYATGGFQDVCAEVVNVSQPSASRCVTAVTEALLQDVRQWIRFPDMAEAAAQQRKFFAMRNFPNVIGCVDGTHIKLQAPSLPNEYEYVNRKGYHSLNVQVVCNADLQFIDVVASWPGSTHDATILRGSGLFAAFEGPNRPLQACYILGDSGYMIRDWLLTPFPHPATVAQERFNAAHMSTRSTVERSIGVAKRRWNCLNYMRLSPVKVSNVTVVCLMLHNRATQLHLPVPGEDAADPVAGHQAEGRNQLALGAGERARVAAGKAERDRLVQQYFHR